MLNTNTTGIGDFINLIKYPRLTEKSINLYEKNYYTFIIDRSLTKIEIKFLLEKIFNIKILKINTCNLPSKFKRVGKFIGKKSKYKKAYIKLKEGDSISNIFA
jgi:large subunit ribosomal protein L23